MINIENKINKKMVTLLIIYIIGLLNLEVSSIFMTIFIILDIQLLTDNISQNIFTLLLLSFFQQNKIFNLFYYEIYLILLIAKIVILRMNNPKDLFDNKTFVIPKSDILFIIFIVINFIGNISNNVTNGSWSLLINLTLSYIIGIIIFNVNISRDIFEKYISRMIIFQFLLILAQVIFNMNITAYEGAMLEPNISAGFFAAMILFLIPKLREHKGDKENKSIIVLLLISIISNVLCVTRTSWIAIILSLLVYTIIPKKKRKMYISKKQRSKKVLYSYCVLIIALISFIYVYKSNELFNYKVRNILNLKSGTGEFRKNMNNIAINDVKKEPFKIRGTSSFGSYYNYDEERSGLKNTQAYLPNLYVATLFDTGIIGFFIIGVYFFIIILKNLNKYLILKSTTSISYFLATITLLVCFYSTNALWFPQIWIIVFAGRKYK